MEPQKSYLTAKDRRILKRLKLPLYQKKELELRWSAIEPTKSNPIHYRLGLELLFIATPISLGLTYFLGIQEIHSFGLFFSWVYILASFFSSLIGIIAIQVFAHDVYIVNKEDYFLGRGGISLLAGSPVWVKIYSRAVNIISIALLILLDHYFIAIGASITFLSGMVFMGVARETIAKFLSTNLVAPFDSGSEVIDIEVASGDQQLNRP